MFSSSVHILQDDVDQILSLYTYEDVPEYALETQVCEQLLKSKTPPPLSQCFFSHKGPRQALAQSYRRRRSIPAGWLEENHSQGEIPEWALETACSESSRADEEDLYTWSPFYQLPEKPKMLTSTGAVDWASYLSWSQADMSAGERARSNVLVMKDRAHEIDREIAIRHILAKDELAGAWILFQDLPCIGGNAEPLGREAYVLAHDCLTMDFRLIWLETLPDSMEEICSALKTGKEVARIGFQDFCDVFEGRSHIDESRSTWAPEKGFQICVWISIATFVLDFHEAFVPDRQSIWTWHKLMREWRQKLEKVEAVEETIDLDSMDIGEQDLTDLPVEDEPFTFMSTKVFKQAELEPIDEMYESEVETIFSPRNSTSTQSSELEEAGIWSCILQSSSKTTQTECMDLTDHDQANQSASPKAPSDLGNVSLRTTYPLNNEIRESKATRHRRISADEVPIWSNPWTAE